MSASKPNGSQEITVIATSLPVLSPFLVSRLPFSLYGCWLFQAALDFFPGVTEIMRGGIYFHEQKLTGSVSHTELTKAVYANTHTFYGI